MAASFCSARQRAFFVFLRPAAHSSKWTISARNRRPGCPTGATCMCARMGSLQGRSTEVSRPGFCRIEPSWLTCRLPSPDDPGHLLFVRGETLLAQAFNAAKLELQG